MGITQAHDTLSEVSVHHETGSLAATGGSANGDRLDSQLGQDAIIYKMSNAGMPVSVYAMDTMPSDGNINGTSENGRWGGWSYIMGLDGFDLAGETDQVAAVGMVRGSLKFPKVGGTPEELTNTKDGSYDPWVAKIDMSGSAGSVVWATKAGISLPIQGESAYPVSVVTTAAGHVIAGTVDRVYVNRTSLKGDRQYGGRLTKYNGGDGALVWSKSFGAVAQGPNPNPNPNPHPNPTPTSKPNQAPTCTWGTIPADLPSCRPPARLSTWPAASRAKTRRRSRAKPRAMAARKIVSSLSPSTLAPVTLPSPAG